MDLVPLTKFMDWAAHNGVTVHTYEPEPHDQDDDDPDTSDDLDAAPEGVRRRFSFTAAQAQSRYWLGPSAFDGARLRWITAFFDLLEPWEYCWAVKLTGAWDDVGSEGELCEVLRGVGIPPGWDGAIRFNRSERGLLSFVLVAIMEFGWCGYYNTVVLPDSARVMLETNDDDITPVVFSDSRELDRFVAGLAASGFPLPTEPPGYGFYWQDWMGPKPPDWDRINEPET